MNAKLDLRRYRLLICLGPGGVGKTTLSAGLALESAAGGRSVDVITIDPAPRLVDVLGIDGDATAPRSVELGSIDAAARGQLRAMRLDPQRTFDELVSRYAPSAAARDTILHGRLYRNLSNALAGVADYMAAERLLALYREGVADLIVLDTPPAADAIDFLGAPRRMLDLMSSRAVNLLGASRGVLRARFSLVDLAARAVLAAFDRITGLHLLSDVQAFVSGFDGMYEGFASRAAAVEDLLHDRSTLIIVVTTTQRERVAEAAGFVGELGEMGLRVGAVAVNRLLPALPKKRPIDRARLPAGLKSKLYRNLADFCGLKEREKLALEALRNRLPRNVPLIGFAEAENEPCTLTELSAIAAGPRTVKLAGSGSA